MADVAIETNVLSYSDTSYIRGGPFWTSATVGYVIYEDSEYDIKYRKTSDGGATWGDAQNIRTGSVFTFDCWADWQTSGDTGTKIHIVYMDGDTDDVRYCYLNTSTDTVGGDDLIEHCPGDNGDILFSSSRCEQSISITKTRGGKIAVAYHYYDFLNAGYTKFLMSADGDTWIGKNYPYEDVNYNDYLLLFPANLADADDLWALFWDTSASEISLKTFDYSADSWSEASIASSMAYSSKYLQMDGAVRFSDGHLIVAAWSQYDNAASDLKVWDITDASTITAKTNIITDEAESFLASVFINQNTNDIYVTYVSGLAAQSSVQVFYQKSTDGGANWGGETAMQADAEDDERWVSAGAVKKEWGGKFQPFWFNDDLDDLFCNRSRAISIAAVGGGWSGEFCGVSVSEFDGVTPAEIDGV